MRLSECIVILVFVSLISTGAFGATIHVPGDQPTLFDAYVISNEGDTILVADGVYSGMENKNLVIWNHNLIFESENGPENCIIEGEELSRFMVFREGTESSILRGFTIRCFDGECES